MMRLADHSPCRTRRMAAFVEAQRAGANGFETDLHVTADQQIVLIHDKTLDRTTNCTGAVKDYTLAQLSSCNAAAKYVGNPAYEVTGALSFSWPFSSFVIILTSSICNISVPIHDFIAFSLRMTRRTTFSDGPLSILTPLQE